jgi:integral membrane protein
VPEAVDVNRENPAPPAAVPPKVLTALGRFRIAALIVGVALIVLVIAMVLRYGFDQRWAVAAWGPIHGALYFGYFIVTLDLSFKARWTPIGTLLVVLAGVVPIGSFYAERIVHRKVLAGERV